MVVQQKKTLNARFSGTGGTEEVGRQHQGMDRPGVLQVPGGSGERRKMEGFGCEIICGAPKTVRVKGYVREGGGVRLG